MVHKAQEPSQPTTVTFYVLRTREVDMLDPASPQVKTISDIFNISLVIAALILALVTGLTVYNVVRFRSRSDDEEPKQTHGNVRLEIAWTLGPALIVAFLFILTLTGMTKAAPYEVPTLRESDVAAGTQSTLPSDVLLRGHQFWWEIRYPSANVVTANELHMPVGKRIRVQLESADVVHGVWFPQLAPQLEPVPGQITYMALESDRPGVYWGACSEFCGAEHVWMQLRGVVQTQADYDAWLRQQSQPAAPIPAPPASAATPPPSALLTPTAGDPGRGAQLFRQKTCISCHAINGTDAQGHAGPDLTHVASRSIIGAGVLDNTPTNMALWIANPQKVKPYNLMPNLLLSSQEVQDLASYMETLK
ncbi:MAG: cytochrome c oxidase subunit II [Chloroflexia bacterium]